MRHDHNKVSVLTSPRDRDAEVSGFSSVSFKTQNYILTFLSYFISFFFISFLY